MSNLDGKPFQDVDAQARGTSVAELPVFWELEAPDWGIDVVPLVEDVFSRRYQGLMRSSGEGQDGGTAVAYRNAQLKALATHPALSNQPPEINASPFYEERGRPPGFQRLMTNSIFTMRPPEHGPARQLISRQLTLKSVYRYSAQVSELIDGIIADALQKGRIDFKTDFANRVMTGFWSLVLGITSEDAVQMCRLATRVQASNFFDPTPDQVRDINEASLALLELFTSLLQGRIAEGAPSVIGDLVAAFTDRSQLGQAVSLEALFGVGLIDGMHSLSGVMCSIVHALIESEHALAEVRADPSLVPQAYYEGVRLHPAVAVTQRYATESFSFDDVPIRAGSSVNLVWLFGNRDPEVFPDPNAYQLERPNRPQTTFGGGLYICPGRNIVKVLSEAVLTALTRPDIKIVPDGSVRWVGASALHEPDFMPVAISRA